MITPTDHASLLTYTTLPFLTLEQANHVHKCMPNNSWISPRELSWRYPVDDHGAGVDGTKVYKHSIVKARPPKGVRQANPSSTEQLQPWILENISRTTWYQRKTTASVFATALAHRPEWLTEREGLKLYSHLASLASVHKLNIAGLWGRVCEVLRQAKG